MITLFKLKFQFKVTRHGRHGKEINRVMALVAGLRFIISNLSPTSPLHATACSALYDAGQSMSKLEPYTVLGISQDSSEGDIHFAYR